MRWSKSDSCHTGGSLDFAALERDHDAIFLGAVGFPGVPGGAAQHYQRWIAQHRSPWLAQIGHEFPWGLIAVVAWQQGDANTVRCWQHKALPLRHRFFWTVTDEVVAQLLPPLTPPLPNPKDCS